VSIATGRVPRANPRGYAFAHEPPGSWAGSLGPSARAPRSGKAMDWLIGYERAPSGRVSHSEARASRRELSAAHRGLRRDLPAERFACPAQCRRSSVVRRACRGAARLNSPAITDFIRLSRPRRALDLFVTRPAGLQQWMFDGRRQARPWPAPTSTRARSASPHLVEAGRERGGHRAHAGADRSCRRFPLARLPPGPGRKRAPLDEKIVTSEPRRPPTTSLPGSFRKLADHGSVLSEIQPDYAKTVSWPWRASRDAYFPPGSWPNRRRSRAGVLLHRRVAEAPARLLRNDERVPRPTSPWSTGPRASCGLEAGSRPAVTCHGPRSLAPKRVLRGCACRAPITFRECARPSAAPLHR